MTFCEAIKILNNNPSASLVAWSESSFRLYIIKCGEVGVLRKIGHDNLMSVLGAHDDSPESRVKRLFSYIRSFNAPDIYTDEILDEWKVSDPNSIYEEQITKRTLEQ